MKFTKIELDRTASLLKTARVTRSLAWYEKVLLPRMLASKEKYQAVADTIGCPVAFVMMVHLRESGSDVGKFKKYLGNGQPINKRTTITPRGRGPWNSWSDAAADAMRLQGIDKIEVWNLERMIYELERWNGFGYRNRGVNSPYVWNYTSHYTRGHYYSDGKFNPNGVDKNIGCYAYYLVLTEAMPSYAVSASTDLNNFPVIDESKELGSWAEAISLAISSFFSWLFGKKTKVSKKAVDSLRLSRNKRMLFALSNEIGVKEVPGSGSHPRIDEYFDACDRDGDSSYTDEIPWCAAFIGFICKASGMTNTLSLMARSYEKWGKSTKASGWLPGDIVVFYRNGIKSGSGHVSVLLNVLENGDLVCGGGNQRDEVNVTVYSPSRMTDIRRSSLSLIHTAEEVRELYSIADDIVTGKKVLNGGKVA